MKLVTSTKARWLQLLLIGFSGAYKRHVNNDLHVVDPSIISMLNGLQHGKAELNDEDNITYFCFGQNMNSTVGRMFIGTIA